MMKIKIYTILGIIINVLFVFKGVNCANAEKTEVQQNLVSVAPEESRDPFQDYLNIESQGEMYRKEEKRATASLPTLNLEGVILEGKFPLAIINGNVLKINDTFNDVKVIRIEKEGVSILYHGEEYRLSTPIYEYKNKEGGKE